MFFLTAVGCADREQFKVTLAADKCGTQLEKAETETLPRPLNLCMEASTSYSCVYHLQQTRAAGKGENERCCT